MRVFVVVPRYTDGWEDECLGVFVTRELAENCAARFRLNDDRIFELDLQDEAKE